MATVINNPNPNPSYAERPVLTETRERSGVGFIVGLVLAVILAILLLAYGIPALRNNTNDSGVNVPDRINVDVNRTPTQ